ncbi:flagellar protein FlgN [Clostridium sp. DJ247]|nr:flagellar protein FlgN [Clostridium sp. DJ247]
MNEYNALKALLDALDEQFEYLTKREVFSLGKVVEKIEQCSREVARWEVERRKITGGEAMTSIVDKMKNENLENNYRSVKKLLEEIQLQKDTNEMIIKQGLGFSTQMLNFINPDRGPKTYNGYGKRR